MRATQDTCSILRSTRSCRATSTSERPASAPSIPSRALRLALSLSLIACDGDPKSPPPPPPLPDLGDLCEPRCDFALPDSSPDMAPALPACDDGVDNDGDGLIDGFDPGCASPIDPDERADDEVPACADGVDNDGDGLIDYPRDPECASADAPLEARAAVAPECDDGFDNDGDGEVDYPLDRGCGALGDASEGDDPPTVPQCADERDNDGDGLVDLSDPGCADPSDQLELNGPAEPRPWCADGLDNDGDGLTDFPRDPGCAYAGDQDEQDSPFPPACNDDEDNDGDDLIDFPYDPGCAGVGDADEIDRALPPQCDDGADNDDDGLIDYPDDPGCFARGDEQEVGDCGAAFESGALRPGLELRGDLSQGARAAEGTCGGDGGREVVFRHVVRRPLQALILRTDLPGAEVESALYVRRRCAEPETEVMCAREPLDGYAGQVARVERPALGEYFIFLDAATNASGAFALQLTEEEVPECRNGVDDDFDGGADFPFDSGCADPFDATEAAPLTPPACADDLDNDGDALTDFPNDVGCLSAGDEREEDECGQGVPVGYFPTGDGVVEGNTARDGTSRFEGSCGGANRLEQVFLYEQPFSASVTFSVDHPETQQPTLLYLRRDGCARQGEGDQWLNELGCNLGAASGKATLRINHLPPGSYYVFVDHPTGSGGPFKLTSSMERAEPSCVNGLDDDVDGLVDGDDLGCVSVDDDREEDDPAPEAPPSACYNGLDDDGDGLIDYPYDSGCLYKSGDSELDPPRPPQCANGRDDDQDGVIDLLDPGCSSAADPVELDIRPAPRCSNRLDDDQDALIDYPADPACYTLGGLSEGEDGRPRECLDGLDQDEDGRVDYPFDPGCDAASDRDERDEFGEGFPTPAPACSDGLDNDEDGVVDFPAEPGCKAASEKDEADPPVAPQCANGVNDDQDRLIDWPSDPQCLYAADRSESR